MDWIGWIVNFSHFKQELHFLRSIAFQQLWGASSTANKETGPMTKDVNLSCFFDVFGWVGSDPYPQIRPRPPVLMAKHVRQ